MRLAVPTLFCVAGLVLQGAAADADTWTVLRGKLTKNGVTRPLSGSLTGSLSAADSDGEPDFLQIDDFSFSSGRRELEPAAPIEYHGLSPSVYLQLADAIGIEAARVTSARLRTGGKLVDEQPGAVTFRFLELRADASHGGSVQGLLDDGAPRRLLLKGDLYEVEQSFLLPPPCPPASPPSSGSGGSSGGSGAILSAGFTATSLPYDTSFVPAPMSVAPAPTLEQLGIRAPDGAEITFEGGALRVSSAGDLFVEGTISSAEIPGLTSVSLTTPARLVVTGRILVPGGTIALNGGQVDASGAELDTRNPSPPPPVCQRLVPALSSERLVGSFSLVASAARQMQIDVLPGGKRNRVLPSADGAIAVAILGSREVDVRDIDVASLHLGRGAAEPLGVFPPPGGSFGRRSFLWSVNGDRYPDSTITFRVRDAGIAFGDRELCLVARTRDGELLEGCDRIDTGF